MFKFLAVTSLLNRDQVSLPNEGGFSATNVGNALTIVFGVAGAVAFAVVVFAGLKFVLSSGNPQEMAKAKDTIINAIIGLVVAASAVIIVQFVVGYLT
jgi:arginine exporter protein ArgO